MDSREIPASWVKCGVCGETLDSLSVVGYEASPMVVPGFTLNYYRGLPATPDGFTERMEVHSLPVVATDPSLPNGSYTEEQLVCGHCGGGWMARLTYDALLEFSRFRFLDGIEEGMS